MSAGSDHNERPAESALHDYALGRVSQDRAREIEAYLARNPEYEAKISEYREDADLISKLLQSDATSPPNDAGTPPDFALARLMDDSLSEEQRTALIAQLANDRKTRARLAALVRDASVVKSESPIPMAPEVADTSPPISFESERAQHTENTSQEEIIDKQRHEVPPQTGEQQI